MKTETDIILHVRRENRPIRFELLLNGRTFTRPNWKNPNEIWFKLDKRTAQILSDSNIRIKISIMEDVYEVILCEVDSIKPQGGKHGQDGLGQDSV